MVVYVVIFLFDVLVVIAEFRCAAVVIIFGLSPGLTVVFGFLVAVVQIGVGQAVYVGDGVLGGQVVFRVGVVLVARVTVVAGPWMVLLVVILIVLVIKIVRLVLVHPHVHRHHFHITVCKLLLGSPLGAF